MIHRVAEVEKVPRTTHRPCLMGTVCLLDRLIT
ncbi:hypothetical protein FHS44_006698 [Streptosporangium saharense]|uniref:Uncharacterized protein n=1 Tax=Streptosporangium saharense TaxID=1706840 RepID=A0A7W7QTM4_9ACTN|nr:hypothetical protein [Streptosporangium saharense]